MKIPYALPYLDERELAEVAATIRSHWLSRGPKTQEFEQRFAESVHAPFAVGLNSCTAALHLAQLALGIGPGDEVITSPMTFVATANTILHVGAAPVFVDIDPVTMNLDAEKLEAAITPRTKAIIPVHFAGFPCDMDRIRQIADRYGLKVIDDAAHAVWTEYKGRPVGSLADITCFSFYATKNLATGEGGMLTTADEAVAERVRVMSLHGMSKNAWNRYTDKGSWYYEVEYPGFKYNMTDIQAAFGLTQLAKLPEMQALRTKYAGMYNDAFSTLAEKGAVLLPHDDAEHRHAWHLYVLRVNEERVSMTRDDLIEQLREAGVGTSVHFIPVPHHPCYRRLGYRLEDCPEAEKAYRACLSLPLYPGMTEEQVRYVADAVTAALAPNER